MIILILSITSYYYNELIIHTLDKFNNTKKLIYIITFEHFLLIIWIKIFWLLIKPKDFITSAIPSLVNELLIKSRWKGNHKDH